MKEPADQGAISRLKDEMAERMNCEEAPIHHSLVELYGLCGGEIPGKAGEELERKLLGIHHRLLTPDQARSAYMELMRERQEFADRYEADPDQWFKPYYVPFGEFPGDAEFLCMNMNSGAVLVRNSLGLNFRFDSIEEWLTEVIEEYSME